jgi:oligoendopeptidase F
MQSPVKSLRFFMWLVVALAAFSPEIQAKDAHKVLTRDEVPVKHRWAIENIFKTVDDWDAELGKVEAEIPKLAARKGTLNESAQSFFQMLDMRDQLEPRIARVYVYASLMSAQDTRDPQAQSMLARARTMALKYGQQMSWFEPELLTIPFEQIDSDAREGLSLYRQYFDALASRIHPLGARRSSCITLSGQARGTAGQGLLACLKNADIQFPKIRDENGDEVELDDSAFYLYMRSTDRRVRKDAYEAIVGTYAQYRNTAAALLNGQVQAHIFTKRARNYDSCLAAALDGGNIPVEVYDNLINTVNENLPLLHRYMAIRKKALKLAGEAAQQKAGQEAEDGVRAYDLFAPLITGQKYEVEYEKAVERICDALKPMGEEYCKQMKKGFDSRWVDVFPTKGKRSGAYSSGTYLTQPYILMNFHNSYEDMSTLAHEMGHSMHSYLSRSTQPYIYSDYDIFCAEVASVTNELLLQDYVLKRTEDPKVKLYLLVEFLEGIRGTLFRQTMFSEFEQKIHEMAEAGQPLTADSMGAVYGEIMKKYYGPDYVHMDLVDKYWIRIPHFYYNFYVYKYATSYCASSNISRRILANQPGAVDAYLTFLKSGSSKYPVELLKVARVDMLSPEPVEDAMKIFEDLLDQTEALTQLVGWNWVPWSGPCGHDRVFLLRVPPPGAGCHADATHVVGYCSGATCFDQRIRVDGPGVGMLRENLAPGAPSR